jgi:single-strand DNA-binding protein
MNIAVMTGTLSSDPSCRVLPSGARVVSLELSTDGPDGARWSVPVAWVDAPDLVPFTAGDEVVVVGSVRRRFFRVAGVTQSRTEVVAELIVASTDRRKVRTALHRCASRLGTDPRRAVGSQG